VETIEGVGDAELASSEAVVGKTVDSGMPPEEPREDASVGCTMTLGTPPVEPTSVSDGVGSAAGSSAVEVVGDGVGRVDSSDTDFVGSGVGGADVGEMIVLGNPPVDPTSSAEVGFSGVRLGSEEDSCSWLGEVGETFEEVFSSSWDGADLAGTAVDGKSSSVLETLDEVGWTTTSGMPPVDASTTEEVTASSGVESGLSEGSRTVGCGDGALDAGGEEELDVGSGTGAGGVSSVDDDLGLGLPVPMTAGPFKVTVTMVVPAVTVVSLPGPVNGGSGSLTSEADVRSEDPSDNDGASARDCDSREERIEVQKGVVWSEDWRSSRFEELDNVDSDDEADEVDDAGAVELVMTCRLTWRGK